jgi:predicted membrane protein
LGELGVPGIVFFLALLITNYRRNNKYIKLIRKKEELSEEEKVYGKLFLMLNSSLIAFAIGGAFLSVAYYPHIFVLSGLYVSAEFMYQSRKNEIQKESVTPKSTMRQFVKKIEINDDR